MWIAFSQCADFERRYRVGYDVVDETASIVRKLDSKDCLQYKICADDTDRSSGA